MKPKHDQKAEHKAREAAMRTMVLRTWATFERLGPDFGAVKIPVKDD